MKFRVYIEVDVSRTIAETMQRNGFHACKDGSAMQIKVQHSPAIPQRKTKVVFVENPNNTLDDILKFNLAVELLRRIELSDIDQHWKDEIRKVIDA